MENKNIKAGDLCAIKKVIIKVVNDVRTVSVEESLILVVSTHKEINSNRSSGLTINYFNNSGIIKSMPSEYVKKIN